MVASYFTPSVAASMLDRNYGATGIIGMSCFDQSQPITSSFSSSSVFADIFDPGYKYRDVIGMSGFVTVVAVRRHFRFTGGTRINNDGRSLSSYFHAGIHLILHWRPTGVFRTPSL